MPINPLIRVLSNTLIKDVGSDYRRGIAWKDKKRGYAYYATPSFLCKYKNNTEYDESVDVISSLRKMC